MALFKIEKGLAANLATNRPNSVEGYCYFTSDDGKFYIDISTGKALTPAENGGKLAGATRMPINSYLSDWAARSYADKDGNGITSTYGNRLSLLDKYTLKLIAAEGTELSSLTLPKDVDTASKFTSAQIVKLTGAVTGTASSQAGWEIPTTLSDNVVTTSKISNGAVTNEKLANSSITIGGKAVNLGGVLTLADIGLNTALRFIGATSTAITDGSTTSSIVINGSNVTPTIGDVIINNNNSQEYVWLGSAWELLGDESSYALKEHVHNYAGSASAGGSANSAVKLDTATAGDSNTPVYFSGGKPVACTSLDLNTSGNAATATKLAIARTISLTGDVTGSGTFDGSDDLSITAIVADDSHNHSSAGAIDTVNPTSQSIASRITYISGGFNLGTGNNQIQLDGMTGNPNHISAPTAGCYNNGTSGNVQVVRFGWPSTNYWTELYMSPNYDGFWHSSVKNGTRSSWKRIWMQGDAVTGAVWNDYAECRESDCEEFGYVLMETGDDSLTKTTERLSHFAGVSSDTWGFSQGETAHACTPIAVAGRVLVYPYQDRNNYKPGDCVCAAPGGTVDIMTREEVREWPDRIVGTVSCVPDYEEWGGGEGADRDPVKVNGRIWIKVK